MPGCVLFVFLILHLWTAGGCAIAATLKDIPSCQGLDADARSRAEHLAAGRHLYDCCDDTVAACLSVPEPCSLALRLADEICRRVAAGRTDAEIEAALELRARSMTPGGPTVTIALDGVPMLGSPDAPVVLVTYACLRCPFCAAMTLELKTRFEPGGALEGKVRWYFKLFPLKGHEGSVEAGLAALAAHGQGRFWPFLDIAYGRFGSFSEEALAGWAEEAGLERRAWDAAVADPSTRATLVAWKREGLANGVSATPTAFLDGRLYQGDLQVDALVDVLLEEHERVTGPW